MPRVAIGDFESSSLNEDVSYPIELGWAVFDLLNPAGAEVQSHLIRPEADWTDWSPEAEALHGISRDQLFDEGIPPARLWQKLSRSLVDVRFFFFGDAADLFWMRRLLDVVGVDHHFTQDEALATKLFMVRDADELLGWACNGDPRKAAIAVEQANATHPCCHRAEPDVLNRLEAIKILVPERQAAG